MRNNFHRIALIPRGDRDLDCASVFYRMHEQSGMTIADALGHGPNFTVSTGTPLATTPGYYQPAASNSTIYAQCTVAQDAADYLENLFDFTTDYENLLLAVDLVFGTDVSAIQAMFSCGRVGTDGGFLSLELSATEILSLTYRGPQASGGTTDALITDFSGVTARQSILIDFAKTGANTFTYSAYVNGAIVDSGSGDWTNNSATGPLGGEGLGDGYIIGARVSGTVGGAKSNFLNTDAGNTAKLSNLFVAKLTNSYAGIGSDVAVELYDEPGVVPSVLLGKT